MTHRMNKGSRTQVAPAQNIQRAIFIIQLASRIKTQSRSNYKTSKLSFQNHKAQLNAFVSPNAKIQAEKLKPAL